VLEDDSEWLEVESEWLEAESKWLVDVLLLLVVDEVACGPVDSPCLVSEVSADATDVKTGIVTVLAFALDVVVVVGVSLVYTQLPSLAMNLSPCLRPTTMVRPLTVSCEVLETSFT
jgi:hypothetical protein